MGRILEALAEAGALFPVEKRPLLDAVSFTGVSDYRMITRGDTGEHLGVVGSTFGVLDHEQAFRCLDEALPRYEQLLGAATIRASLYAVSKRGTGNIVHGSTAGVDIQFREYVYQGRADLYPTVNVQHGLAGEKGLNASGGVFKKVCTNGMIVGTRDLVRNLRHNLEIAKRLEHLDHLINRTVERMAGVEAAHDRYASVPLGYSELGGAIRYLLTGSSEEKDRKPKGFDRMEDAFYHAPGSVAHNVFGLVQAATYFATHLAGNRDPVFAAHSGAASKLRARAIRLAEGACQEGSVTGALLWI